ncbi:MAG: DNA mismatch repair endonuclease MutL, partial [Thermomicrobiales bacterium]
VIAGPEPFEPIAAPPMPTPRAPIRVLPASVSARIAAGETIERPASAVKELAENAIDAGARSIRIDIRGGGLGSIRVGDDGCGIRAADLWLACQRHATSKLPPDGLDAVRTLGFRGEALPSIAAVSDLEIISCADESGLGWRLAMRGGDVLHDEPAPRPRGTTVTVRRIFERMPARLAAMQPRAELTQIGQTVRRLAAAAPQVQFTLWIDDRLALQTSGGGDPGQVLTEIYGADTASALLPLGPVEIAGARLSGVIAGPEFTRAGRGAVHLCVNGRATGSRALMAAMEAAWRPLLPRGRHPVLAVHLDVPAGRVDVNVHPAKEEVRLRDEREIAAALARMIRDALGRQPIPLAAPPLTGLAALLADASLAEKHAHDDFGPDAPIVTAGLPPLRLIGQVDHKLLLLEGDGALFLVDQHRAHERILFERMRAAQTSGPRQLADPLLFEVRSQRAARFAARLDDLAAIGFTVETFGGRTFLLRAAPDLPGVLGAGDAALDGLGERHGLIETLLDLADDPAGEGEEWQDRLLVSLACRGAVRRGRELPMPAMRALVEALGATGSPAVCPHGSPLLMRIGTDVLSRQFGW